VLQEVAAGFEQSFDRQVGDRYPFSARVGTNTAHEGSGTWSRYPLLKPETLRISPWGNTMHRVRLSTGRGEVWLYNIHLPNPTGENREDSKIATLQRFQSERRDYELDWLIDETADLDLPYILAGDFNVGAGSFAYRRFPTRWQDAQLLAGRGFGHTFPSPRHAGDGLNRYIEAFPWIRIDYVLTSPEIRPVRVWHESIPESDHLALIVELEL
jgi:endonuclease/exonuclease/phosphatase family metal-dependent hydrolase